MIALALGLDANFFDKPDTLGERLCARYTIKVLN
jgi:hypothetical protein